MSDSKPIGALQDTVYSIIEKLAKLRAEFVSVSGLVAEQRAATKTETPNLMAGNINCTHCPVV